MALIDKLTNIADAIRGKTGGTDELTLDAMAEAIAGIETGGGGSDGGASGIYMAKITPARDASELTVTHNLGTTDILLAVCFAETLGDVTPTFNGAVAKFWAKTDIPRRVTSSENAPGNYDTHFSYSTTAANVNGGLPNSEVYFCTVKDENNFIFDSAGSSAAKYITGVTYTVIIMAASAFKETEV